MFFHPIGVDESVGIAVVVGDVVGGGISAITNVASHSLQYRNYALEFSSRYKFKLLVPTVKSDGPVRSTEGVFC